jgi:hypothetical protein
MRFQRRIPKIAYPWPVSTHVTSDPSRRDDNMSAREQAELNALLQEIMTVKAEIVSRLNAQLVINGGNIVLTTALLTAALAAKAHVVTFVLALPLVSVVATGLFLSQDSMIIASASYLDRVLRPRVQALVKSNANVNPVLMSWESYLDKWRRAGGRLFWSLGAFGPILILSPASAVLVGYAVAWLSSTHVRAQTHGGEVALWLIGFVLTGITYLTGRGLNRAYHSVISSEK